MLARGIRRFPAALFLLLLTLPLWCLYSESGTRFALHMLDRFSPLELDYQAGKLGGTLALARLELDTPAVRIAVANLHLALDSSCLWQSELCLTALSADSLAITTVASNADASTGREPTGDSALTGTVRFPVAINAPGVYIGRTSIQWPGGQWTQDAARFNLRLRESSLRIAQATVSNARLVLIQDATAAPRGDVLALPTLALPFALNVLGLELTDPAISVDERDVPLERIYLSGRWVDENLRLAQLDIAVPEIGTAALRDGRIAFIDNWPLSAEIALRVTATANSPLLAGRSATLGLEGDLSDLTLELASAGAQQIALAGQVNALDPLFPFSAELQVEGDAPLPLGDIPALPPVLADSAIHFPLQLSARGNIDNQELTVQMRAKAPGYAPLDIDARATLGGDTLSIATLSLSDSATDSALRASGDVTWADGLGWAMRAESSGLELPPTLPLLRGRLQGHLRSSGQLGDERLNLGLSDVSLTGEINGMPAQLSGDLAVAEGALLAHSELRARLNEASLTLTPSGGGTLIALDIADLGNWLPDAAGSISAQATLRDKATRIAFEGEASALRWRELRASDGTFRGELDRTANDAFSGQLRVAQLYLGAHALDSLLFTAQGDATNQRLQIASSGAMAGELDLRGTTQDAVWQGALAPTALTLGDQRWTLERSVDLRWSDDVLQVAGHCWRYDAAQLCPGDWSLGRSGGGSLAFEGEVALFSALIPLEGELAGDLAFSGDIAWTDGAAIEAQAELRAAPLSITRRLAEGETVALRARSANAHLHLGAGSLALAASLLPESGGEMALDLQLPPERNAPLAGTLHLNNILLQGFEALSPQITELAGTLNGRLRLSGTVNQPLAHGRLQLSDGVLAVPVTPTRLEALNMQIEAKGDSLSLAAEGLLGNGPLTLRGSLSSTEQLRLSLQLRGENNTLLYPPTTSLRLSPSLDISATAERLGVTGEVTVHRGVLRIQELPEGSVDLSADVVQVDSAGEVLKEQIPFAIDSNVRVRVEDGFTVTGDMLEAALSGDLQLRRRSREPLQVFGSLETLGGQVTAYERVLQIQRGTISFSGAPDNPLLDVRAERRIAGENITAGIHVHGELARDLKLDVYSEPPMSQGDAMSYLIWGRSLDSGTNTDGAVLALSLASSVVNRSSLVQEINRVPGISRVSFGAEGSEDDAAATVSGYVGERLYLSYGFGLYEPVNVVTARLFLQTRLWLEVVSRLENSVDLFYSFDID